MQVDYQLQTALAVWSVAVGGMLCAVYDVFRVFRLRRAQNKILLFFCDFLFCVFAAISMLILFFNLTYGKVRVYSFVFALVGFMLWRVTVSKLFTALVLKIIDIAEKLLNSIKLCVRALISRAVQFIYTKNYCRTLVNKSKYGFGTINRKELQNEQKTNSG